MSKSKVPQKPLPIKTDVCQSKFNGGGGGEAGISVLDDDSKDLFINYFGDINNKNYRK